MHRTLLLLFGFSSILPACIGAGEAAGADDVVIERAGVELDLELAAAPDWSLPSIISQSDSTRPQVAIDPTGRAVAVWWKNGQLVASHYTPNNDSWTAPVVLVTAGGLGQYQIAMDDNGAAIVVWHQMQSNQPRISVRRYTPNGGWDPTQVLVIGESDGWPLAMDLAMSPSGNAFFVWNGHSAGGVLARRYVVGTGWTPAETIATDEWGDRVSVAIDGGGAVAVWSNTLNVYASRYQGSGWGAPDRRFQSNDMSPTYVDVFVSDAGSAMAVWSTLKSSTGEVWIDRRTPDGRWSNPERIAVNDGGHYWARAAGNANGAVVVAWTDDKRQRILARRFHGTAWTSAEQVYKVPAGTSVRVSPDYEIRVTLDALDNAHLVWVVDEGSLHNINASGFTGGGAWRAAKIISLGPKPIGPVLTAGPAGSAMAMWVLDEHFGDGKIIVAHYR